MITDSTINVQSGPKKVAFLYFLRPEKFFFHAPGMRAIDSPHKITPEGSVLEK